MSKAEIRNEYKVTKIHEISVDFSGWNFLLIYGKHINGWFIAIPNWNICVEATNPSDTSYNIGKLSEAFNSDNMGKGIAEAIKEHWESVGR